MPTPPDPPLTRPLIGITDSSGVCFVRGEGCVDEGLREHEAGEKTCLDIVDFFVAVCL